jgi:nucleolar protein 14
VEEFEDILEGLDDEALPIVVQRIRALHHPSLAQGNKEKLQEFLGVLLDYILILASEATSFKIISALAPHLTALVKLNPLTAASHFVSKLTLMQKNLQRGISRGASNVDSKTLPRAPELVMLRFVGATWSTSDFSHPVVQPAVLLIGQYLSQSRVRNIADMASGLFLCSLIAQYEAQSKRLVPEVITFLATVILGLVKRRKDVAPVSAYPDLLSCSIQMVGSVSHRHPVDLLGAFSADDPEQSKADLLGAALQLISSFTTLYSSSPAFIEIFTPLLSVLEGSRIAKLDPKLKAFFEASTSTLSRQLGFARDARTPLTLQDHKPIPIASYAPKFEDDFAPGKHYDPDAERNAASKLRAQYKKERKGAIRELRKDNRFLAGERARAQETKDAEYNAKMRKIVGSLNTERAEEKQMEREKKHEKRRRG